MARNSLGGRGEPVAVAPCPALLLQDRAGRVVHRAHAPGLQEGPDAVRHDQERQEGDPAAAATAAGGRGRFAPKTEASHDPLDAYGWL